MTVNAEHHDIDNASGFAVHKEGGGLVGVEQAVWPPAKEVTDYPKWVTPHDSHVVKLGDAVSTPLFEHHVARDGGITVLVVDAEHEKIALSPKDAPAADEAPASDEPQFARRRGRQASAEA